MWFVGDLTNKSSIFLWVVGITGFFLFILAIILSANKINKIYRCPKCKNILMSSWGFLGTGGIGFRRGVPLNPKECPHCHTRLK